MTIDQTKVNDELDDDIMMMIHIHTITLVRYLSINIHTTICSVCKLSLPQDVVISIQIGIV
jgi:hypothetical protein